MRERLLFERRFGVALLAISVAACASPDGYPLELGESSSEYDEPCPDADGDGECDADDFTCNADGTPLTCRRVAPSCPRGTVPEVREGCYTDRCLTWDECADCELRPSVPREDPLYDRFEGTASANRCETSADCMVGGCSGEVCAAENVYTTCELLPYGPEGGCGCVEGQCVWHTRECAPPECRSDADCPDGQLCQDGTCVAPTCEPTPTVSPRDAYYDRFEGTASANRCETSADCVVGGCSGEVCAAETVYTTCEVLPYGPEGGCGCVEGQCVWNRDSCSGGACEPIRDGEFGACDAVLGFGVLASTGRCGTVSGCGCSEPTCGGRVFETQRACEASCGLSLCFRDDVPLSCRMAEPVCPSGTVPEVRDGCYTNECVPPELCVPPPPRCRVDEDCPTDQVCRDGVCGAPECSAVPTVPRDDRYYDRFEGTSAFNGCRTSSDCVRSGCSGEVCAAEAVATTCELLPYGPSGDCGCVEGQCIWHRMDCGAEPTLCAPVRPGEFGLCRMDMGWGVSAISGACVPISGCGCGEGEDSTCGGRLFPTEAECRRACAPSACRYDADGDGLCDTEDTLCNSDGSELACRRVEPACSRGTVPEVREGCYTDRCVTWDECARLSDR